jgi:pyruvate formate lyase activating enzyme
MILPYLDLIYYDIKLADSEAHRKYVGRPNERILHNLCRLVRNARCEIVPRIPLVPGITSTDENLAAIVRFLQEAGADQVSLLPYNPMGIDKYQPLGRTVPDLPRSFMKPEDEEQAYDLLHKQSSKR